MSKGNLKNKIREYQENLLNMNVFIFYFSNFHTKSSKILKYALKNVKSSNIL
jgi:uncharacterized protein (DUF608 family)